MLWLFAVCWTAAGLAAAQRAPRQRGQYLQTILGTAAEVQIQLGDPPEQYQVLLRAELAELVVTDVKCGLPAAGCPRYCDDFRFAELYCPPHCNPMVALSPHIFCPRRWREFTLYDENKSRASKLLARGWSERMGNYRSLWGMRWSDTFSIIRYSHPNSKTVLTTPRLETGDFEFVATTLFDSRILFDTAGVFGLKPGPKNPIVELHNAGHIGRPAFSITIIRRHEMSMRRLFWHTAFRMLTIGDVDRARCAGWEWFPTTMNGSFTLTAEKIEVMGVVFEETFVIQFSFDDSRFFWPRFVENRLVEEGRVARHVEYRYYSYSADCNSGAFELILHIGGKRLRFGPTAVNRGVGKTKKQCLTVFGFQPESRHSNQRVWTVGTGLLLDYCLGFDYERGMMGFGRRRPVQWPLPSGSVD